MPQQAEVWRKSISSVTTARMNISRFGVAFRLSDMQGKGRRSFTAFRQTTLSSALPSAETQPAESAVHDAAEDPLSQVLECVLDMSGPHPRWLQRSDILPNLFNMSSQTFQEAVGALTHVEAVKKATDGQLRLTANAWR